jgi:hypothetical protein
MKNKKTIFVLALMAGLIFSNYAYSQAIIERDLALRLNAFGELNTALSSQMVTSNNGNRNLIVEFKLSDGNPFIPAVDGEEAVYSLAQFLFGIWWEGEIVINSDGKVKVGLRHKANS